MKLFAVLKLGNKKFLHKRVNSLCDPEYSCDCLIPKHCVVLRYYCLTSVVSYTIYKCKKVFFINDHFLEN